MRRILIIVYLSFTFIKLGCCSHCSTHPDHILCTKRGFASRCGLRSEIRGTSVSKDDIETILAAHNEYRNKVASGLVHVPGGLMPVAASMEQLIWDTELAALSENYVKRCLFAHSCDQCANVERFIVGENLHWRGTNYGGNQLSTYSWSEVVKAWTREEEKYFHVDQIKRLSMKNAFNYELGRYGHLSQSIWGTTRLVGCGRIVFKGELLWETISSCHYGPAGNVIPSSVYAIGQLPCSRCSNRRNCSFQYTSLCEPDKETTVVEIDILSSTTRPRCLSTKMLMTVATLIHLITMK